MRTTAESHSASRDPGPAARASARPDSGRVGLPRTDLPRRYLKAGDLMFCRSACEVTTVLGSCVAVTFFSAQFGLGAICHAMLPAPKAGDDPERLGDKRWKFVCFAIDELIRCFQQPGLPPSAVEVKVFGGGHLLQRPTGNGVGLTVGAANVALACRLLAEAGFAIVASDVGGPRGRKVVFNTKTGSVHVKTLGRSGAAS